MRLPIINTIRTMDKPVKLRFILTCRFKLDSPTREKKEMFAGFNGGKPILITDISPDVQSLFDTSIK